MTMGSFTSCGNPHHLSGARPWRILAAGMAAACLAQGLAGASDAVPPRDVFFQVQVVDEATDRGVPLVELETVNHLLWVTDSAGRAAVFEPGLMGAPVFFHVRSHGHEFAKDGFGYAGVALTPVGGGKAVLKLKRLNVAERLYRVTGEGIYRDSVLVGEPAPLAEPLGSGKVVGQDSVFGEVYKGRIFWFWGDTSRMRYPLGHFWMASATSELPGRGGLDPSVGVNLKYFTDAEGFSRPLCRLGFDKGLIWADAFLTVRDESGRERLVCHYAHMESLEKMLGHGMAIYNDDKGEFERVKELDLRDRRRFPGQAHPIRHSEAGIEYFYFGEVFPDVRVRAELKHILDPASYEALTCLEGEGTPEAGRVMRTPQGKVLWEWRRQTDPVDGPGEKRLVARGELKAGEARFLPIDTETGKTILMHRGSVRWNAYRQRWIMIATQADGTSPLGEVWYAEAREPAGPWLRARKIVTHDRYSFYNPVHHAFFDQEGGRVICFEGTYANTFSGNPTPTPRYDYNQIMYRLDLDDPRLKAARAE